MARFNLTKLDAGQRFRIKKSLGLDEIRVELTFSGADLDVQAWLLDQDGLIINDEAFVYYNSENRSEAFDRAKFGNKANYFKSTRPMSADGAVLGAKDELEGGIETVNIVLSKVDPKVQEIIISATIYEEDKTFADVTSAKITVIDEQSGESLCQYDLTQDFATENACVTGGFIISDSGDWEFEAKGNAYSGGLQTLIDMYA